MTPPFLIVKPDRDGDGETSSSAPAVVAQEGQRTDRRRSNKRTHQRMRAGLRGLLTSTDRRHTITVLYSLNAHRTTGRLRLVDPGGAWPAWLAKDSRLWLSGYDGRPLRIRITVIKLRREGANDDEQFAEFVVPPIAQQGRQPVSVIVASLSVLLR